MALYIKSHIVTCQSRAENDALEYYGNILKMHELALEESDGDSIARMDLIRLKAWIKEYITWANHWHLENYENASDITDHEELKLRYPPPRRAPKLRPFESIPLKDS